MQNAGGEYECKPYPYSGWCNAAAWAYAPGLGEYWQDAWTYKGSCGTSNARTAEQEARTAPLAGELQVYPNPSSSGTSVKVSLGVKAKSVAISMNSVNGATVLRYRYNNPEAELSMQLPASLPKGMYIFKVVADQEVYTQKFLVE